MIMTETNKKSYMLVLCVKSMQITLPLYLVIISLMNSVWSTACIRKKQETKMHTHRNYAEKIGQQHSHY